MAFVRDGRRRCEAKNCSGLWNISKFFEDIFTNLKSYMFKKIDFKTKTFR